MGNEKGQQGPVPCKSGPVLGI